MPETSIVIIGGGASGALLATQIVQRSKSARVAIVEPRDVLGRGMAYSTDCPAHLLNVPAAKMSAFVDDPGHFVRWLQSERHGTYDARSFVPRPIYGSYLTAVLGAARARSDSRIEHVCDVASDVVTQADGVRVRLRSGAEIAGDRAVLAFGNAEPAAWPGISSETHASPPYFPSAWAPGALVPRDPAEKILVLGTGLTAVDAVLALRYAGHRGAIDMVSRRGLLPHEHRVFDTPPATAPDAPNMRALIAQARAATNWRRTIDGVRPAANALWQDASLAERRSFLRHVMPYWNVHRHRIAPAAAQELAGLIGANTLRMIAGRTGAIAREGDGLCVAVTLRGTHERVLIRAERAINCSGPEHDVRRLPNPLVRSLLASGRIAAHPLGIGLQVAPSGALIDANADVSERLFAIGPVRFGALIETAAIPEIRVQAAELAATLIEGRQAARHVVPAANA